MQILRKIISLFVLLTSSMMLVSMTVNLAHAEAIDRIQINQSGDEAEIQIRFVTRIQFLRQVMLKNGDVRLYFNLLENDPAKKNQVWQRRDSPPSNLVPRFTVTYPEIDSSLTISFGKELSSYHIRPGNDGRSISFFTPIVRSVGKSQGNAEITVPIVTTPSQSSAVITTAPAAKRTAAEIELTEAEATQLMENANAMLGSNLIQAQAAMLRKLVALPPNKQSQIALKMLGQAHEKLGEFDKARAAYYAYMGLYPKAKDYKVMEQSVSRMIMAGYAVNKFVPEKIVVENKLMTFGSFSQFFSKDFVRTDSISLPGGVVTPFNGSNLSELVSTLELTGMRRTESTETRLVLRDSFTASFLSGIGNNNFLDAAYIEQVLSDQSYYYGIGRQTGSSGGVPSRYDGVWLGHNFNAAWRVNATVGQPVRALGSAAEAKTFAGINVTLSRQPGQWSGNAYLLGQRVSKILDRRAAGIETHYYDDKRNHTALIEYDTLFKRFNFGSFQGNWITANDDNYTMLLEHRRSPSLRITNALFTRPFTQQSISDLLNAGATANTLRDDALSASPVLNQFSIGMTRPYSPRLKFGGDIRVSNTTSYMGYDSVLLTNTIFPKVRSTTITEQLIGNNLLFDNDLGVASFSYTSASTYKAKSLSFSQVSTFKKDWRLDLALLLYAENNVLATIGDTTRISPTMKLSYQMRPTQNLEFGAGYEQSHTTNSILDSRTRRKFFNAGYRWDFQ